MKKTSKNTPSSYKSKNTPIFRDTTALPFADGGPLNDKTNHGEILNSVYASALGNYYKDGGQFQGKYSLPEDSFKQGGKNLHDSIYASSPQQYPGIYESGGNLDDRQQMYMPLDHVTRNGGSILSMSNTPEMSGERKDLTYPKNSYAYNNGGHLYPDGGKIGSSSGYAASRNPNAWRAEYAPLSYNYNDYLNSIGYRVGVNTPNVFPNISGKKSSKIDAKFPASIDVFQDYHDSSRAFEKDPTKYNIPGEYEGINTPTAINPLDISHIPYERGVRPANLGIEGRFGVHGLPGSANTEGSKLNVRVEGMAGYSKHKKGYAGFETGVDWKYSKKDPGNLHGMLNTKLGAGWPLQVTGKAPYSHVDTYAPNVPENTAPTDVSKYEEILGKGAPSRMQMGPKFTAQADFTASKGPLRGAQIGARGSALFDYNSGENTYHSINTLNSDSTEVLGQAGNVDFARKQPILNAEIFGSYPLKAAAQKLNIQDKIAAAKEKDDRIFNDVNISGPSGNMGMPSFNKTTATNNNPIGAMPGFSPETNSPVSEEFTQERYNTNPMMNYKSGGGIHINPAHEGDFTAKANAAGMGVQEFASKVLGAPEGHYDPSTRRQANFARNAASWNHAMGGNMYANGGSFNNKGFRALPTNVQNKIKSNSFAEGGSMGQLTEFNEGGTHEESPLGGIPQGTAPDGKVNLVEQGETKLNSENYVFSDTLKIDKDTMATFAIPKTDVGKTFAEVSKKANRPNSRRENDTIEQVAIKRDLDNLMNAQEAFKAKEVQKKIEEIQSLDPNALAQVAQSYQPQGMPPQGSTPQGMEEMPQEQPQGQPSQEEMMMAQGQGQPQEQMDPAMMQQMMAQQEGQMAYGGPMSYKCGGSMYDFGGTMRTVGAAAYGIGEGVLDAATMGLTDSLTDKGYDALSGIGNASKKDLEAGKSARGFGNVAGAVTGAIINPATIGSAVSEGSEGLAAGLSNISGTNEKFDKAANTLGQVGSVVGSFVGGNPTEATGMMAGNKGANALMQFGNKAGNISNLMEGASASFAGGGHLYPTNYPTYTDNAGPMGQSLTNIYEQGGNQYGGDLDSPTEDDMIARLEQEESDMATRSFEEGGTFNVKDRDMFGNIRPSNVDYGQYNTELANPWDKKAIEDRRAEGLIPKDAKFGNYTRTKEELEKYLSDLQAADETLKDKNPNLNMNQTLGQAVGLALPAAYNISQGLFGKVGKLNPEDYYQKADFTPYQYNIDPQKAQANITFAQAQAAARNAAPGAGAYLSNMQQAGLMRNDAYAKLYAEKQNIDAANALDAKVRNKAIEAANKGVLSNVTDYNIKAKEAKRQMLAAGLKQGADIAKGASEMDAQAAYMKLLAPDYAGTFNYNTIFDQLVAARKAAKTNANNKTV